MYVVRVDLIYCKKTEWIGAHNNDNDNNNIRAYNR